MRGLVATLGTLALLCAGCGTTSRRVVARRELGQVEQRSGACVSRGRARTKVEVLGGGALRLDVQVLCVWRRGFAVHQVAVQRDEAIALGHLLRGESFGVLCEAFASAAEPEKRAASVVAKWFDDERIATPEEHVN